MGTRLGTRRRVTGINVTPLVDVVLVLLIVFMVMAPLADKQMPMRVPEHEPHMQPVPPDQVPPDRTVLVVKADGRVLLDGQEKPLEEAMRSLHEAYGGRPSKVLFFNAEDGVKYGLAVKVLDAARQAGVDTIGMMTDAPPPGAGAVTRARANGATP